MLMAEDIKWLQLDALVGVIGFEPPTSVLHPVV